MHISEMHCKYEKYAKYDQYDRYVQYAKYDKYETTTLAFSANGPSISLLSRFMRSMHHTIQFAHNNSQNE